MKLIFVGIILSAGVLFTAPVFGQEPIQRKKTEVFTTTQVGTQEFKAQAITDFLALLPLANNIFDVFKDDRADLIKLADGLRKCFEDMNKSLEKKKITQKQFDLIESLIEKRTQ